METDFASIKRGSRIAAILTAVASIIVLVSLLTSYHQTLTAKQQAAQIQKDIDAKKTESVQLQSKIDSLKQEATAYQSALTHVVANSPASSDALTTAINASPALATQIPRLFIHIVSANDMDTANAAANAIRAKGFIVPPVERVSHSTTPEPTGIQYFYSDAQTQTDVTNLTAAFKSVGIVATAQLQTTNDGKPLPSRRTYRFWFPTLPAIPQPPTLPLTQPQ